MLRIGCEFNERLPDGGLVALLHGDERLEQCAEALGLADGTVVLLTSLDNDFEVVAMLREQPADPWIRWVAYADWDTIVYFDLPRPARRS